MLPKATPQRRPGVIEGDMAERPICPLCEGTGEPHFTAGEHRMFRCTACRSAFVYPQPSEEYLERFYAAFHDSGDDGWYNDIESRMQADFPAKLRMFREHLPTRQPRVLDVGCGKGWFVRACLDAGCDAEGIDLSSSGVEHATNNVGVTAHLGTLQEHAESLGVFDGASFWATIEHVPDPVATLSSIANVLRPGGVLALTTGIADDRIDRWLPGATQWYDPPQHLFVLSARGIRAAAERAGLEVIDLVPCFERTRGRLFIRQARGFAAAALLRAVTTATGITSGRFAFTRYPLGNEMFVVCRKPT